MKKSIGIVSFMAISMMSCHAMELIDLTEVLLIDDYGSLTEDTFDMIQEQKQTFSKPVIINPAHVYLDAVHSSLKLDQLSRPFCALSERSKREVMRTMSLQLLYLHAIALLLPPEIVKNHIVFYLLDDEKEALDQFYALPFVQAFDLYHEIKTGLADDSKLVGPLYAKSKQVRELVLKLQKNSWYYSLPTVNFENKEEIDVLPNDIKNMYLQGKEILILPEDEHNFCTPQKLCKVALIAGGVGSGMFGLLSAGLAIGGACGGCGAKLACESYALILNLDVSCGLGCFIPSMYYLLLTHITFREFSERLTI